MPSSPLLNYLAHLFLLTLLQVLSAVLVTIVDWTFVMDWRDPISVRFYLNGVAFAYLFLLVNYRTLKKEDQ